MKISIVVPCYNSEKTIRKCIDSILSQNFRDYELLLIDDGSTDKSGIFFDEYTMKDIRVNSFHIQRNEGISSALELGIKKAKGDFITFVDCDDYLDRFYLERMHNAMLMNSSDMVFCDYVQNDGTRNMRIHIATIEGGKYEKDKILRDIIPGLFNTASNTYLPSVSTKHWAKMFKTDILKSALKLYKKYEITSFSDLLTISGLINSDKITYLKNEYLYHYKLSSVPFEKKYFNEYVTYYNNADIMLNAKKIFLQKEFYYFKINLIIDSVLHLKQYTNSISKRRIINELKEITSSDFFKTLEIKKEYKLNKQQKIYLFLLRHNLFTPLYYILCYKFKNKK